MIEGGSSEIVFVYNGQRDRDKQALAYASILSDKIRKVDVGQATVSRSFLSDLAAKLGVGVDGLIDNGPHDGQPGAAPKQHPDTYYFDLLTHQPSLLRTPILIYGDKGQFIGSQSDILALSFL